MRYVLQIKQMLSIKIGFLQVRVETRAIFQCSSKDYSIWTDRVGILHAPVENLRGRLAQQGGELSK